MQKVLQAQTGAPGNHRRKQKVREIIRIRSRGRKNTGHGSLFKIKIEGVGKDLSMAGGVVGGRMRIAFPRGHRSGVEDVRKRRKEADALWKV